MKTRQFTTILTWEADEDVWVSVVASLNYLSIFGDTQEVALADTREAILGYLEVAHQEGIPLPESDTAPEARQVEIALP